MRGRIIKTSWALALFVTAPFVLGAEAPVPLRPTVEIEEEVYTHEPADNGAGPMWCSGSTCLTRIGPDAFASGLETLKDAKPLNNCRWMLFRRGATGWDRVRVDEAGRTREPCPVATLRDGRLFLSSNPTLAPRGQSGGGPARPEVLQFSAVDPKAPPEVLLPGWSGKPAFTEHSYRSFAADGPGGELILFQNVGYTHAEWSFRDKGGQWSAQGRLVWPWGADYEKPEPIRVCYPNVALKNRAVYFCGVSDIIEPRRAWREFKKQLTGRDWDYDFRRLFFTWTPDITREKFRDWVEIASREETCGWISPGDLWVAPDDSVHVLWTERALDERLRAKFFPAAKQRHALNYAVVREGRVTRRRTLAEGGDGLSGEIPSGGRFQVTPDNRLFVFYYAAGRGVDGKPLSENRLMEVLPGDQASPPVRVPLKNPFTSCFTATVRGGSPPSNTLDLLGLRAGAPQTISYARVRLF
jgi:hypothetical protein